MTVHFASSMVYSDIFFSEKITVPDIFIVNSLESANKQSQDSDDE